MFCDRSYIRISIAMMIIHLFAFGSLLVLVLPQKDNALNASPVQNNLSSTSSTDDSSTIKLFIPKERKPTIIQNQLSKTPCVNGNFCPVNLKCCIQGCCIPPTPPAKLELDFAQTSVAYFLTILGLVLLCGIYCLFFKRGNYDLSVCYCPCCGNNENSERDSAGSTYPPPRYSRCGSFHQAPPPYAEVTSKPDLYPIVITCAEGDGKTAENYLMVHYFKNYVIQAPGSLSATSTAESLNSNYLFSATNEANTIVPPPYSSASNYDEWRVGSNASFLRSTSTMPDRSAQGSPRGHSSMRPIASQGSTELPRANAPGPGRDRDSVFRESLITSPVQPLDPSFDLDLDLDCEMYCEGCKPRLGNSPPIHRSPSTNNDNDLDFEHNSYGLNLCSCRSLRTSPTCESPPQPTSPTQSRDSTLIRASEERRHRRLDSIKKSIKARKSSLYMPLSTAFPARTSRISPGTRASSRSAPVTPCSSLVPNLLNFTQRVTGSKHSSRSSRLEEESNPLLNEIEQVASDHKF